MLGGKLNLGLEFSNQKGLGTDHEVKVSERFCKWNFFLLESSEGKEERILISLLTVDDISL